MEFSDNQDPFRGAITNLLIVRCNIHKMTATKSDATFHNIHCLRRFYNNFLLHDFDNYELEHIKYENGLWMAHATRWEEDVGMYIVLTNFNREW